MTAAAKGRIAEFLQPGKRVHLVGIGGVSMRPLGLVLHSMGVQVSGSDMNASASTDDLIAAGIPVAIGHSAENIRGADCLIRTAAARNDNPEISGAREMGIPVFERAQAWGYIMQSYRDAVCIAGTHGKTTTTSMVTHIFMAAGKDPTVMIGGYLPLLGAGHRVGSGDSIILESCEYCDSFLNFFPTTAVVLNVDKDHLDYFKNLEHIKSSFRAFAELTLPNGTIIANADDENTMDALERLPLLTFGTGERADVRGENFSEDFRTFDVTAKGEPYCHIELAVSGKHNAMNALAACAVAYSHGIDGKTAAEALATFTGAGRRMERKGEFGGAVVYDDYAHHPKELKATLETARSMGFHRVICAFQPHTYSRTNALFGDFVEQLKTVDIAVLAEIYAAREQNTVGISSRDLQRAIPGSVYCETLQDVTDTLRMLAQPGDLILTVGAGDIYKAGEALLK
ncbi:MAG: UDP-N-acetylmuramate--L-alanine ligase [Oscillospiraceae bacterium]|nr:UDP-N-acetylmuramate--L-alanine ligase [Oscillospiraceae bacterium]